MRRFSGLLLLILFVGASAGRADSVTLAWDRPPGNAAVEHYTLYWGLDDGTNPVTYRWSTNVIVTTAHATGLEPGRQYWFCVTATAPNGLSSAPSAAIPWWTASPAMATPPDAVWLVGTNQYSLERSFDLKVWSVFTGWSNASAPQQFFRLKMRKF